MSLHQRADQQFVITTRTQQLVSRAGKRLADPAGLVSGVHCRCITVIFRREPSHSGRWTKGSFSQRKTGGQPKVELGEAFSCSSPYGVLRGPCQGSDPRPTRIPAYLHDLPGGIR